MVSREGYYDYMLRRSREEDTNNSGNNSTVSLLRREIIEMQRSTHALQMRVKALAEDNYRLKVQNANLHNNEH